MAKRYIDVNGKEIDTIQRSIMLTEQVKTGVKECSRCKEFKPLCDFHKSSGVKCGYVSSCKLCKKLYTQIPDIKEKTYKKSKEWKKLNAERVKETRRKSRLKYKDRDKIINKQYYIKKRDSGKIREYRKILKERNPWIIRMRKILWQYIKRTNQTKNGSTETNLGFSRESFKLKFPVLKGGYEIDHKIPISWFKIDSPVNIVHHLDNLQQITIIENREKGNLYCSPINARYKEIVINYIKVEYKDLITLE